MPMQTPQRELVTAIECDLWDGDAITTLRLCDVGPILGSEHEFEPRLFVPIEIGSRIVASGFSDVLPSAGNSGGTIELSLQDSRVGFHAEDNPIWAWLDRHWQGRTFRIYIGELGASFADYTLAYTGRIDDLTHDTLRASIKIGDASIDLDDVLVSDLYPKEDGIPDTIQGRPKPEVRGSVYNVAPILLTDTDAGAPLTYQVSRLVLDDIMEVRVGGIPWDRVALDPVAGQWAPDLAAGTLTLGGITGGLDVRCDARGVGWATMTTATLMTALITEAGGAVDTAAMTALDIAAPYTIGWFTDTEERNRLDAFDAIMTGVVGWWGVDIDGLFSAGVLESPPVLDDPDTPDDPDIVPDVSLNHNNVDSIQLSRILPPAWRVRVEHTRNWSPLSSFADAVRETDKQRWEDPGIVAAAFEDETIKTDEPRAVDLPLIRSLVNAEADAIEIRDRAADLFSTSRRLYETKGWVDPSVLFGVASVEYLMVSGSFRVLGVTRAYGAGPTTLHLWG
jgi:hypothetical protein